MVCILFIQGGGKGVHDGWDNKLVESLQRELGSGFEIRYPLMPNEADPKYGAWKAKLEEEFAALPGGAFLVAHSIGASVLINALAEGPPNLVIGGIFLVAAPFVGEGGWPSDGFTPRKDLGAALPDDVPVFLYRGTDDDTAPIEHVSLFEEAIPDVRVRLLQGRDHQLNNDLSEVAADIKQLAQGTAASAHR